MSKFSPTKKGWIDKLNKHEIHEIEKTNRKPLVTHETNILSDLTSKKSFFRPTWKRPVSSSGGMVISRPQIPNSTLFSGLDVDAYWLTHVPEGDDAYPPFMAQSRSTEGFGEWSRDASCMFHYFSKTHGCVCVCVCFVRCLGEVGRKGLDAISLGANLTQQALPHLHGLVLSHASWRIELDECYTISQLVMNLHITECVLSQKTSSFKWDEIHPETFEWQWCEVNSFQTLKQVLAVRLKHSKTHLPGKGFSISHGPGTKKGTYQNSNQRFGGQRGVVFEEGDAT